MAIAFNVRLGPTEWAPRLSGWNCPVLRIPGIAVTSLEDNGVVLDSHWYEVRADNGYIKWNRGAPVPSEVTAFLEAKETLITQQKSDDLTRFWKTFSLFVPIVAALIAAVGSYLVATHNSKGPQTSAVVPNSDRSITPLKQPSSTVEASTQSATKAEIPPSPPRKNIAKIAVYGTPSFPYEMEIADLTKRLSSGEKYSWPQYDSNLQSLNSILSAFVDDLQSGKKIGKSEEDMFFHALQGAVGLSRGRACSDLPDDGFADIHCTKNFNIYDSIIQLTKDALSKGDNSAPPEQLARVQNELAKWLKQSLV